MTPQPTTTVDLLDIPVLITDPTTEPAVRWEPGLYDRVGKPIIDRMSALLLLLVLLPLMVGVAIAVYVELGRPLFFRQRRVGKHGRVFQMIKFRTMHPCRRERQQPIRHDDRRRQHKTSRDPRHTTVGRFLRRTSLDELPQLLNVLKGDMSLVGPRPELESIVRDYAAWQHQRHLVKPGITGLWQVTARSEEGTMHLHTDIDLDYVERVSLRTDLTILLRTPLAAVGKTARDS